MEAVGCWSRAKRRGTSAEGKSVDAELVGSGGGLAETGRIMANRKDESAVWILVAVVRRSQRRNHQETIMTQPSHYHHLPAKQYRCATEALHNTLQETHLQARIKLGHIFLETSSSLIVHK